MAIPLWTKHELARALNLPCERDDVAVTGISIDSRTTQPGDMFVALIGEHNGHDYAKQAQEKGAVLALVSEEVQTDIPTLHVPDTLQALNALGQAGKARAQEAVRIAITGSCGKTTTKEMLRHVLGEMGYKTHASQGSFNNDYGVPLTLALMPRDTEVGVFEVGTNHPGEVEPLTMMVAPDCAVLTNVAPSHIGHFEDLAAIAKEKLSIATSTVQKLVTTSALPEAFPEFFAPVQQAAGLIEEMFTDVSVQEKEGAQHVTFMCDGEGYAFDLNVQGDHMVTNAFLVLGVVRHVKGDLKKALQALSAFQAVEGRGQVEVVAGITLVDESYNANPASMAAAFESFKKIPAARQFVIVGDMLELGEEADMYHAALAPLCAGMAGVICVGPHMKALYAALDGETPAQHYEEAQAIGLEHWVSTLQEGDAVLVKGSKKMFWAQGFVLKLKKALQTREKTAA